MINVSISTSKTGSNPTCTESIQYGILVIHKVHCSPPARGRYVTVTLIGNNVTLVLCQVVVRTIGKSQLKVLTSFSLHDSSLVLAFSL